jgi:hypothetical protein
VSTLLPVVGFGANDALRPLGKLGALRLTLPVNPLCGVTVIVDVLDEPCTTVREVGEALMVNAGRGLTVSAISTGTTDPFEDMPATCNPHGPTAAELLAVSVITLLPPVVEFGLKLAVTPTGSCGAERITLPTNPFRGVTVMVAVVEDPRVK